MFVAGDHLSPDKLRNALYALGVKRAKALFSLRPRDSAYDFTPLAEEVIYPFEQDVWPEEITFSFGHTSVRPVWALFNSRSGETYRREGYGGRGTRSVSYCFAVKNKEVCIGAGGRFAQIGKETLLSKQNQSICRKI